MSKPAAIQATFADYKRIRGRKVGQLVFEVPLETLHDAIANLGGEPDVNDATWCVIARMANGHHEKGEPSTERRRFHELPIAQQAAMRCQEPVFRAFLREDMHLAADNPDEAAEALRGYFEVASRRDIPANEWAEMNDRFLAWKTAEAA